MTTPNKHLPKPVGLAIVALVVVGLVAALLVGGRKAYDAFAGTPDYSGSGSGSVTVQIASGDTARDIGATLLRDGVVKSTKAFTKAAQANSRSRGLQPGFYALKLKMSAVNALTLLLTPSSRRGHVIVPEGQPLAKTVAKISAGAGIAHTDLEQALANPAVLGLPSYANGKVEGFLFPSTYDIEPGTQATDALQQMTEKFGEVAAAIDLEGGARALGLTPYQVVTIASIVEAETPLDADRGKVARVVLNRLKIGMRLQLDSTLNYVRAERKARLSTEDISESSPYNTYKVAGLPPTPIDSPGQKAIEAVLHPATGDWIYFVTIDKQGHSLFTSSYQAFLAAKAKAQQDGVY